MCPGGGGLGVWGPPTAAPREVRGISEAQSGHKVVGIGTEGRPFPASPPGWGGGGASLVWQRANKAARTLQGGPARGKCHRGGSSGARKWLPLLFCLPNYIIEKATQQGALGGRRPAAALAEG